MSGTVSTTRGTLPEAWAARAARTGVMALARPSRRRLVARPADERQGDGGAELSDARIRQLIADHVAATEAVHVPDVTADLTEAARDTARILGLRPADSQTLGVLLTFARRSYAHGHMDATEASRERAALPPLALLLGPNGGTR